MLQTSWGTSPPRRTPLPLSQQSNLQDGASNEIAFVKLIPDNQR
jgi:hypothetical protein